MEIETLYVVDGPGVALLRGRWRLSGTGPDGQPVELAGSNVEVARRQPDGRWLYVIDHPFGAE